MITVLIVLAVIAGVPLSAFTAWMFSEATSEEDPDERAHWVFMVKFWGPIGAFMYWHQRY